MIGAVLFLALFVLVRVGVRRRRRTNARRDLTQAFRADTSGLHPRSPGGLFLRGDGGGL